MVPWSLLVWTRWAAACSGESMVTYIELMGHLGALFAGFVTLAAVMVQREPEVWCMFLVTRWMIRLSMVLQWVTAL